ncbi:MAG: beta-phosphoglucomutase [Anaerolinea sp.]|nr:beta-phosphoglucomutase [Anaerolinea sp.]
MKLHALIFDLDGVIADTASYHFQSWQQLAAEEGWAFTWELNERLRSLARRASLEIILAANDRAVDEPTMAELLARKNYFYLALLEQMDAGALLPGVLELIAEARAAGLKLAVASASRNAVAVLQRTGVYGAFDAVVDSNSGLPSKPAPDLLLRAAAEVQTAPAVCLVLEDAAAGIDAALAAGMWTVGLGPPQRVGHAHLRLDSLAGVSLAALLAALDHRP